MKHVRQFVARTTRTGIAPYEGDRFVALKTWTPEGIAPIMDPYLVDEKTTMPSKGQTIEVGSASRVMVTLLLSGRPLGAVSPGVIDKLIKGGWMRLKKRGE